MSAIPVRLQTRAWRYIRNTDQPLTAIKLGDRAGITSGAALHLLTGWAAAGLLAPGRHPSGRYAPYLVPYHPATPNGSPQPTRYTPEHQPASGTY